MTEQNKPPGSINPLVETFAHSHHLCFRPLRFSLTVSKRLFCFHKFEREGLLSAAHSLHHSTVLYVQQLSQLILIDMIDVVQM